jgi:hypothetical protein
VFHYLSDHSGIPGQKEIAIGGGDLAAGNIIFTVAVADMAFESLELAIR